MIIETLKWLHDKINILYGGIVGSIGIYLANSFNNYKKQQIDLIVFIEALCKECKANSQNRGNSKRPFQIDTLKNAVNNAYLKEKCKEIFNLCEEILPLAQNANVDNFYPHRPGQIQIMMTNIANKCDEILPSLRNGVSFLSMVLTKKKYLLLIFLIALFTTAIVIIEPLYSWKNQSIPETHESSQVKNNSSLIEKALMLELPPTNTSVSKEAKKFSQDAFTKIQEGNYAEAINITLSGLEKFPQNFILQSDLASLLGDFSEITPMPLKGKMIQRAKELFKKLMLEVKEQPEETLYGFKNEYYFRFGMYLEQYELGLTEIQNLEINDKASGYKGYYSQGVGASNYARKLIEIGNEAMALDYAQKAIIAWAQYFSYKNDYYNSYVHYALALGILGYKEEMMRALKRSASLINHDMDYHEFKEVIDFVNKINTKQ